MRVTRHVWISQTLAGFSLDLLSLLRSSYSSPSDEPWCNNAAMQCTLTPDCSPNSFKGVKNSMFPGYNQKKWGPFAHNVAVCQHHKLICYVTATVCWLLWQRSILIEKTLYRWQQQQRNCLVIPAARDMVQYDPSYKMQLTRSGLSSEGNLSPQTDECHLLHSLVICFNRPRLVILSFVHQK